MQNLPRCRFDAAAQSFVLILALTTCSTATSSPAWAQAANSTAANCAASAITARGEPSRFEWLAKTKARANWRRRVRLTTGLGPAYADWKLAENMQESCLVGSAGTVCTLTATPCAGR